MDCYTTKLIPTLRQPYAVYHERDSEKNGRDDSKICSGGRIRTPTTSAPGSSVLQAGAVLVSLLPQYLLTHLLLTCSKFIQNLPCERENTRVTECRLLTQQYDIGATPQHWQSPFSISAANVAEDNDPKRDNQCHRRVGNALCAGSAFA